MMDETPDIKPMIEGHVSAACYNDSVIYLGSDVLELGLSIYGAIAHEYMHHYLEYAIDRQSSFDYDNIMRFGNGHIEGWLEGLDDDWIEIYLEWVDERETLNSIENHIGT